jgi:hypothetical protein
MQMSQIPLIALGRIPAIKRNKVLGNVVFWIGLLSGALFSIFEETFYFTKTTPQDSHFFA